MISTNNNTVLTSSQIIFITLEPYNIICIAVNQSTLENVMSLLVAIVDKNDELILASDTDHMNNANSRISYHGFKWNVNQDQYCALGSVGDAALNQKLKEINLAATNYEDYVDSKILANADSQVFYISHVGSYWRLEVYSSSSVYPVTYSMNPGKVFSFGTCGLEIEAFVHGLEWHGKQSCQSILAAIQRYSNNFAYVSGWHITSLKPRAKIK